MIKTVAVVLVVLGAIMVFRPHIKEQLYESEMRDQIAALELTPEQETRLLELIDRVGDGYRTQEFSDPERATLQSLSNEIKNGREQTWTSKKVQLLAGRFEAVLRRNDL